MSTEFRDKKYFSKKMLAWFQKTAVEIMETENLNYSAFGRHLGMQPGNVKRALGKGLKTVPLEALLRMCHHYSLVPDMFTPATTREVKSNRMALDKEIVLAEKSLLKIKKSFKEIHQKKKVIM